MPDFRVIPSNPIVDAVDRRGQNYMLAGPVTTDFSAGVKGLMQGIDFGTTVADRVLTTRRENDPDKLAAEQLRRELLNQQVAEAVRTAAIENTLDEQYGFNDRALDQERVAAGIGQTVASTRKTSQEANLLETYGAREKESEIASRYATAGKNAFQTELLRKYGAAKEEATIDKYRAQADKARGIKPSAPPGPNPFPLPGQQQQQPQNPNFRRIPDPGVTPSNSTATGTEFPENSRAINEAQLMQEMDQLEFSGQEAEIYNQRAEVKAQNIKNNLASKRASDANTRIATTEKIYSRALEGTKDVDFEGTPNYPGVLGDIAELNAHYKQEPSPKAKEANAEVLSDLLTTLGPDGIQSYIDSLEGVEKEDAKKVFSSAVANSGNFDLYTDEMKVIVGAGLDPVSHASDPEKVYSQVEQLISQGSTNLEDPWFKKALRSSEYVIAATKASKKGTQPYTIEADRIQSTGTATDIAANDAQSQKVMVFRGADGTAANAPVPQDLKSESELALIEKVASRQQQSIPQQQQIGQTVQGLQQQPSQYGAPAQQPLTNRNEPRFGITDTTNLPKSFPEQVNVVAHQRFDQAQKNPADIARKELGEYRLQVAPLVEEAGEGRKKIIANQKQVRTLEQIINTASATGNSDFIGKSAKLDRIKNTVANWVWMGDAQKNQLLDMLARAESEAVLAELSGKVTAFNTPAEQERLIRGTISANSEFATIANLLEFKKAENTQLKQLSDIINIGRRTVTDSGFIYETLDEYLSSDVSKPIILNPVTDPKNPNYNPNAPDFVKNPKFQTAAQFLGMADLPPDGGGGGGTTSPDVVTNPAQMNQADVVQRSPTSPVNSIPSSQQSPAASNGFSPQTAEAQTNQSSVKNNIEENAKPGLEQLVGQIANRVLPGSALERYLKIASTTGGMFNPEAYGDISPEENKQLNNIVSGIDYVADSILFNSGEEIMTAFGLAPENQQQFERARQIVRDEFQQNNTWTAGAMDAFGTVVDMVLTGGAAKKIFTGAAGKLLKPDTVTKMKDAVDTAGNVFASKKGGQIITQAALDGTLNALRQEDDSNLVEFMWGAGTSGIIQKALIPTEKLAQGTVNILKKIVGSPDPAEKAYAKRLIDQGGVTKESLMESLQKARSLAVNGEEANVLGTLSDEATGVTKGIARQPGARPQIGLTAADRDAASKTFIEGSEKTAGLTDLRPSGEIADDFSAAVKDTVDEEIAAQTAKATTIKGNEVASGMQAAETEKLNALGRILQTTKDAAKSAQQVVNDITKLIGIDTSDLSKGAAKASGGSDTEALVPATIKQLRSARNIVTKLLKGGKDNPGALFRQLETKYGELDEDIIQQLDDQLRDKFPQNAPSWINTVARKTEQLKTVEDRTNIGTGSTALINNSFRFLDELRQFVRFQQQDASTQVSAEAAEMIIKAGDEAIEAAGGGKGVYTQFLQQFKKLSEVGENLDTMINTGRIIQNQTAKAGSRQALEGKIFGTSDASEGIEKAYGPKGAATVRQSTQAYDTAVKLINNIQKQAGKIDIPELARNLKEADTLANNKVFFAKELIKQGSGVINRLRRTLGPKERGLLEEGVVRVLRDNLDNFKGNVEGPNFQPKDMFGLKNNEWKTVKQLVGPEKAKVLEKMLEQRVATERAANIFKQGRDTVGSERVTAGQAMTPRRLIETTAQFALDLLSAIGIKTASRKEVEFIMGNLGRNPREVNAFVRRTADLIETIKSPASSSVKVQQGASPETIRQVEIALYALWASKQDANEARSNTAAREAKSLVENRPLR